MAAGMKIVTIIKAGNNLPTLWVRGRGRKKGQDLPTEHVLGQMRAPSSGAWLPSFHCLLLSAILDCRPLPQVHFCLLLHWLRLPGSARCEGACRGGALAGAGSIPQPEPTPRGAALGTATVATHLLSTSVCRHFPLTPHFILQLAPL